MTVARLSSKGYSAKQTVDAKQTVGYFTSFIPPKFGIIYGFRLLDSPF